MVLSRILHSHSIGTAVVILYTRYYGVLSIIRELSCFKLCFECFDYDTIITRATVILKT